MSLWILWQAVMKELWAMTIRDRFRKLLAHWLCAFENWMLVASVAFFLAQSCTISAADTLRELGSLGRTDRSGEAVRQLSSLSVSQDPQNLRWLATLGAARFSRDLTTAIQAAEKARAASPLLTDLIDYELASAAYQAQDYVRAISHSQAVLQTKFRSPWEAASAILLVRSYLESNQLKLARQALTVNQRRLPGFRHALLSAKAHEASGDLKSAAMDYQRLYFGYPLFPEAAEAKTSLDRLQQQLGDQYPHPAADLMMTRGRALIKGGQAKLAAVELAASSGFVDATDKAVYLLVRVKAELAQGNSSSASALAEVSFSQADWESERLWLLHQAARKSNDVARAAQFADQLAKFPQSEFRLEALSSTGNMYLLADQNEQADRYYSECARGFPATGIGAICQWRVAWRAYLERLPTAEKALKDLITLFPKHDRGAAGAYFLGRLWEERRDFGAAAGVFRWLESTFPNSYYQLLSRDRLTDSRGQAQVPAWLSAVTRQASASINGRATVDLQADAVAKQRIDRYRLLSKIGWDAEAEQELRFSLANEGRKTAVVVELLKGLYERQQHARAVRLFKVSFPEHVHWRLEDAPEWFWKLGFPLPFREQLSKYSQDNGIDEFVMAGLIRQESEFDPQVLSYANAHGLTQIMPATGRELARKFGVKQFSPQMLLDADFNLKLGTHYFGYLSRAWDGMTEAALASYNGGKGRVTKWLNERQYRAPEEFAENIPLTQTREYVQIVLRNADIYRRLYGNRKMDQPR
jgi:soluble lytic murein transglycosylase